MIAFIRNSYPIIPRMVWYQSITLQNRLQSKSESARHEKLWFQPKGSGMNAKVNNCLTLTISPLNIDLPMTKSKNADLKKELYSITE
jgi:hypothetical protein